LKGEDPQGKVMGVLLHGDAAFAGQGIVYETMQLANTQGFGTGGSIHIVCNNQIGFTTDPEDSRSTRYCSDIGKAFEAPIFHVNADDPEAVTRVFELAAEWRQTFRSDVIIDLIGYRRNGHNEIDQASFTQPAMYAKIDAMPTVYELYRQRLLDEGSLTEEEVRAVEESVAKAHNDAFDNASSYPMSDEWLSSRWKGFHSPRQLSRIRETGVSRSTLEEVGAALTTVPDDFTLHPQLRRIMKQKKGMIESGEGIDWGTGEALAFGSLVAEDNRVRLTGQDVQRGTFSHRHAILHDYKTHERYMPLMSLADRDTEDHRGPLLTIKNSPLIEYGLMGFELGYSLEDPNQLVMWEAQFGDFVNGAQIIIDQFLTSGEQKWMRQCGLTLLLPHGYDGQGPEHSSCRLERFLQASDDDENVVPDMDKESRKQIQHHNLQVVNCTTPANYFHVLRRQVHRDFRKPLVVASPKALLRHKMAVSSFDDMSEGTAFHRVIPEVADISSPRRLIFCSGKVYYDLVKAREEGNITDVAIARVEQIAPFPFDAVAEEVERHGATDIMWVQEEPRNMGAWSYVAPRIATATRELCGKELVPAYAGRTAAASPAVGVGSMHDAEQHQLLTDAFAK
jgi:2-oxoglutarate dehydrogenase E1 component